ncbi:MAG: sugar transferase [Clostridia bacterium]|nr:sugar transferase [Clostridia bacterium]
MYAKFFKRVFDFSAALLAVIIFSPLYIVLTVTGAFAMHGNPFFLQHRPGKKDKHGKEKIFKLIKFRTMSNKYDDEGNLLPDDLRLNKYGKFLRSTSLDELPEAFNILKGDMSVIGPRPQLVRDMVFMTENQRRRHDVRPGLSGLAQINGRNNITWEDKLGFDLQYIDDGITFLGDVKIIVLTVIKAFIKRENISQSGFDTAEDLGDYLLRENKVNSEEYRKKMDESKILLKI